MNPEKVKTQVYIAFTADSYKVFGQEDEAIEYMEERGKNYNELWSITNGEATFTLPAAQFFSSFSFKRPDDFQPIHWECRIDGEKTPEGIGRYHATQSITLRYGHLLSRTDDTGIVEIVRDELGNRRGLIYILATHWRPA